MATQGLSNTSQTSLEQTICRILSSGKITRKDEQHLLEALHWDEPLSHEDQAGIQQVYLRLQMGLLKVA